MAGTDDDDTAPHGERDEPALSDLVRQGSDGANKPAANIRLTDECYDASRPDGSSAGYAILDTAPGPFAEWARPTGAISMKIVDGDDMPPNLVHNYKLSST
jgi:hypothetical protein